MDKWQKIYSTNQAYQAEIVKSVLENEGIPAVVLNKKDSNYQIGQMEIHVLPDDVLRAIKIINDEIRFE